MLNGIGVVKWVKGKRRYVIILPEEVSQDSCFPFRYGEKVNVEIDLNNKSLIITKTKGE
jgi:riboflavin synthase alpha subunit